MRIKYGNQNTQDYKVACFLNTGAPLTPMSAMVNLDGCTRLASRVNTINNLLNNYYCKRITTTMKRTANGKRYAEYRGTVPQELMDLL